MRLRRLVFPLLAAAVTVPLVSNAGAASPTPTFQQYTSPVGVDLLTGAPEPIAGAIQTLKHNPAGVPVFGIYSQKGIGDSCGEPSLGVDNKTGNVLYECGLQTLKITGFGKGDKSTWRPVQPPIEGLQSSDPILWRDPDTGRVFINQLMPQGCSVQSYSDDFGSTWIADRPGAAHEQHAVLVDAEFRIVDAGVIVLRSVEYDRAAFERHRVLRIRQVALAEFSRDHAGFHDR